MATELERQHIESPESPPPSHTVALQHIKRPHGCIAVWCKSMPEQKETERSRNNIKESRVIQKGKKAERIPTMPKGTFPIIRT